MCEVETKIYELDVELHMGNIGGYCGTSVTGEITPNPHLLFLSLELEGFVFKIDLTLYLGFKQKERNI